MALSGPAKAKWGAVLMSYGTAVAGTESQWKSKESLRLAMALSRHDMRRRAVEQMPNGTDRSRAELQWKGLDRTSEEPQRI